MAPPTPRPHVPSDATLTRVGRQAKAGSWSERSVPVWVLLPLRLFLGCTFVYAGLQKLSDPKFFDARSASSIQEQLRTASHNSPIGSLLGSFSHVAVLIGVLIAFGELAVGVGTLLGLWNRLAAVGGLLLSLGFLLAVSWHSDPYYLGPDIVFCFAWTALLGPPGPGTVDRAIARRNVADAQAIRRLAPVDLRRREFLARGRLGVMAAAPVLVAGGLAAALGRVFHHGSNSSSAPSLNPGPANPTTAAAPTSQSRGGAGGAASSATPTSPASSAQSGSLVGSASSVPVGGAASFTDPATGTPALVVQAQPGQFKAFSAVCPHQGCTVDYSRTQRRFICPCHGAEFDATTGAVQRGPALDPLPNISVAVRSGQLYADG